MSLIVYGFERCPSCRSVLIAAKALGLELQLEYIDTNKGDHLTEEFLKVNPAHTVPLLKDGDYYLWDSHAIIAYLANKYAKTDDQEQLYPKDVQKRSIVDQMLYFDSGTFYVKLIGYFKPQMFEGKVYKDLEPEMKEKCRVFEKILSRSLFAAGNHVTVADIALMSSVHVALSCDYDIAKEFPVIGSWIQRVKEALPFYDDVNRTGQEELAALYRKNFKN
ncbi:Glutathione S-Transferase [Chamberlinius hualienensis]